MLIAGGLAMPPHLKQSHTFIVRLWLEDGKPGKAEWRGTIVCVQTGELQYFRSLAGLEEKLARLIEDQAASDGISLPPPK